MGIKLFVVVGSLFLFVSQAHGERTLFYSSQNRKLSRNVLKYLSGQVVKGPISLVDVAAAEDDLLLLKSVGRDHCKFGEAMQGGFPMLFDGFSCHTSDTGIISYFERMSKPPSKTIRIKLITSGYIEEDVAM